MTTKTGVLRDIGGEKTRKLSPAIRSVKMLRPICPSDSPNELGPCMKNIGPGWWYDCEAKGHNPYFSRDRYGTRVVDEVEEDENGDLIVVKQITKKVKIPGGPNIVPVPVTGRHNGGQEIRKARGKGFVFPEEKGCSPLCQFIECWSSDIQFKTPFGDFCDGEQAAMVAADALSIHLDVGSPSNRTEQLGRARAAISA